MVGQTVASVLIASPIEFIRLIAIPATQIQSENQPQLILVDNRINF